MQYIKQISDKFIKTAQIDIGIVSLYSNKNV